MGTVERSSRIAFQWGGTALMALAVFPTCALASGTIGYVVVGLSMILLSTLFAAIGQGAPRIGAALCAVLIFIQLPFVFFMEGERWVGLLAEAIAIGGFVLSVAKSMRQQGDVPNAKGKAPTGSAEH